MEKGDDRGNRKALNIVLTGPECTAKSTLAKELASHYGTVYVPEYAREYVQSLDRAYRYGDVQHIARMQLQQMRDPGNMAHRLVFFDTYLEITRVWFDVVYDDHPGWIDDELSSGDVSLYLLCAVDLPWIPDGVRENGGPMRTWLFSKYRDLLEQYGLRYKIVSGIGKDRILSAIAAVDDILIGTK